MKHKTRFTIGHSEFRHRIIIKVRTYAHTNNNESMNVNKTKFIMEPTCVYRAFGASSTQPRVCVPKRHEVKEGLVGLSS